MSRPIGRTVVLRHARWVVDPQYRLRKSGDVIEALAPGALTELSWIHSGNCCAQGPVDETKWL